MAQRMMRLVSSRKVGDVDESKSHRPRLKSIDRLITNFYEIVGLDESSREISDRSVFIDKIDTPYDGTGTCFESSSNSNDCLTPKPKETKFVQMSLDTIQEEKGKRLDEEYQTQEAETVQPFTKEQIHKLRIESSNDHNNNAVVTSSVVNKRRIRPMHSMLSKCNGTEKKVIVPLDGEQKKQSKFARLLRRTKSEIF